jgi:ribonuclease-3
MPDDLRPAPRWGLYLEACTHRSYAEEHGGAFNQRLEFIGDAVLKLVVAEWLFERYPRATEGQMSAALHPLVSNQNLADVARARGLGGLLRMGKGASAAGDRDQDNPLADLVEALIGAVYLDQGLEAAREVIRGMLDTPPIRPQGASRSNPKGALQEWAQAQRLPVPTYREVRRSGPPHQPVFQVEVRVEGRAPAVGEGSTLQAASAEAAQRALRDIAGADPGCPADLCE